MGLKFVEWLFESPSQRRCEQEVESLRAEVERLTVELDDATRALRQTHDPSHNEFPMIDCYFYAAPACRQEPGEVPAQD